MKSYINNNNKKKRLHKSFDIDLHVLDKKLILQLKKLVFYEVYTVKVLSI